MTSYHGGKKRIGKQIANVIVSVSDIIIENSDFKLKGYCEPFCGMLGVYEHIPELLDNMNKENRKVYKDSGVKTLKYKAGDQNKSIIMMWKAAQKGWKPPKKSTLKQFNELKDAKASALRGFVGHQYSFGGQFFQGFRGKYNNKASYPKAAENVSKIGKKLKKVSFSSGSYDRFSGLEGYIIYCDPPYSSGDNRYFSDERKKLKFDNKKFWQWCKIMSENNIVFVSEYTAPKGTMTVYKSKHKLTGKTPLSRKREEKLFVL